MNMQMTNFPGAAVLLLLRGYKRIVSPLLPTACRYVPTCSDYCVEAVERYGIVRGGLMAIGRILRCHPFAKSGYDPVENHPNCGTNAREVSMNSSSVELTVTEY